MPNTPDHHLVADKEQDYKTKMKNSYGSRLNAHELPKLSTDNPVYILDLDRPDTVTQIKPGRSHIIITGNGMARRN